MGARRLLLVGLWVLLTGVGTGPARACVICIELPKETVADRLLEAEVIALARPAPEDPYRFVSVRFLKGAAAEPAIPHLVDSLTRPRLRKAPDDGVLFVQDEAGGPWDRLAYADPAVRAFVARVLDQAKAWAAEDGDAGRYAFFASFVDADNEVIRQTALLEIGRAPYRWIRRAGGRFPRERAHAALANPARIEWHALYILMLGQSEHPADRDLVRRRLERAARYGSSRTLAAWATAGIEMDGIAGVRWLERTYLAQPARTKAEIAAVTSAMSVQGSEGAPELRAPIVEAYGTLIATHPSETGRIAWDLLSWQDWSHVGALTQVRDQGAVTAFAALHALSAYVATGREALDE